MSVVDEMASEASEVPSGCLSGPGQWYWGARERGYDPQGGDGSRRGASSRMKRHHLSYTPSGKVVVHTRRQWGLGEGGARI